MAWLEQVAREATEYQFNAAVPLTVYLRMCEDLLELAQYASQRNEQQTAYVHYVRYVDLCTNKLPQHPEFRGPQTPETLLQRKKLLQLLRLEVPAVLQLIEKLRAQLARRNSLANNMAHDHTSMGSTRGNPNFDELRFSECLALFQKINRSSVETPVFPHAETSLKYPDLPKLSFPTF